MKNKGKIEIFEKPNSLKLDIYFNVQKNDHLVKYESVLFADYET
jgi:hypothetical protein